MLLPSDKVQFHIPKEIKSFVYIHFTLASHIMGLSQAKRIRMDVVLKQ